jgi:predicted transcriptional regulator
LKKVYTYAHKVRAANSPKHDRKDQGNSSGVPDAHTYIMCVAKGDNGCGCVGEFVPILIWPFTKTYTAETYRRIAEEQRLMHSHNGRNGIWKIFYGTTHGEMITRRMKLRGEKPLDLNQLRKRYKIRPKGDLVASTGF